jgi:uncharacterized protein (TIRG00374 family)
LEAAAMSRWSPMPASPDDSPQSDGEAQAAPAGGHTLASGGAPATGAHSRRSRWSRSVKVLRPTALVIIAVLALEYIVVPALNGASKNLDLLSRLQPGWVVGAVFAEAASLAAYAMLVGSVLPGSPIRFWRLQRIVLATTAVGHVVPAGGAGSAGVGYRLLTESGVSGADAGFAWGTASLGSAVVLNALLWVALLVSIPMAGFHPIYVVAALLGLLLISAAILIVFALTRGEQRAVRIVRAVGRRIPRVGADRMEALVHDLTNALVDLAKDPRLLRNATGWAAANWLLDAAALWCFLAALGRYVEPFELFAAYGIANLLAAIPVTPGGLGVVDATAPALLVSFGVPGHVATLGVLGWRLVNYWLPIPTGAIAYVSLRRQPDGVGRKAFSRVFGRAKAPPDAERRRREAHADVGTDDGVSA